MSIHVASNSLYLISFASFTLLTYLISPKEEIPKYLSWDYLKLNHLIFNKPITDAQYPSLKKKKLNFVGQYYGIFVKQLINLGFLHFENKIFSNNPKYSSFFITKKKFIEIITCLQFQII
jgi:hypothetical protein